MPYTQYGRRMPAYVHRAPIESKDKLKEIMDELLDLTLPIRVWDLASLSAPAREHLKDLLSRKKVPLEGVSEPVAQVLLSEL